MSFAFRYFQVQRKGHREDTPTANSRIDTTSCNHIIAWITGIRCVHGHTVYRSAEYRQRCASIAHQFLVEREKSIPFAKHQRVSGTVAG